MSNKNKQQSKNIRPPQQAAKKEAVKVEESRETPVHAMGEAPKSVGRYVVTFDPPSFVGERARRMEVEANTPGEALDIWRNQTGFLGATAVPPVVQELVAPPEGEHAADVMNPGDQPTGEAAAPPSEPGEVEQPADGD